MTRLPSPRFAWRTRELVSDEHRLDLGRSLTATVHSADERFLPSASPLDRGAVRASSSQLLELASRLLDLERPVMPRGVLLVERLLSGRESPLYARVEQARGARGDRADAAALERETIGG